MSTDSGACTISRQEIVAEPSILGGDQLMLQLLQKHGAPVKGIIYFEQEPGYHWTSFQDMDSYHFTWEKVA